MKTCSTCRTAKELDQFSNNKAQKDGLANVCKPCFAIYAAKYRHENKDKIQKQDRIYWETTYKAVAAARYVENKDAHKNYKLKKAFGIDLNEYNQLFKQQNECCAICKKHQSEFKKALAVDHCHSTGKVRGLLCSSCNNGLGRFKDDTNILGNAFLYLQDSV